MRLLFHLRPIEIVATALSLVMRLAFHASKSGFLTLDRVIRLVNRRM